MEPIEPDTEFSNYMKYTQNDRDLIMACIVACIVGAIIVVVVGWIL